MKKAFHDADAAVDSEVQNKGYHGSRNSRERRRFYPLIGEFLRESMPVP